jgi:hypothetical protein
MKAVLDSSAALHAVLPLDRSSPSKQNVDMTTTEQIIDHEVTADGEALIQSIMNRTPLDPEVARRIRERAERITEQVYREHGLLDIAVPAVRELRDR